MLFLYYLFMTIASRASTIQPICHLVGFIIQYSQMSTFFWLSAIGFNVWNSFRKMEDPSQTRNQSKKLGIFDKRFKWYALYSWGCPMVVTLVTLVMQYVPKGQNTNENLVYPEIGKDDKCTLEPERALFFYSFIIIGPILVTYYI